MNNIRIYYCTGCKTVLLPLDRNSPVCCDEKLNLLVPNVVEATIEKHLPVLEYKDGQLLVKVGSMPHPMTAQHFISWIYVQTTKGGQYCNLTPEDKPEAIFTVAEEEILSVLAYCNLHGLWQTDAVGFNFEETVCSAEFPDGCIDSASPIQNEI